MRLPKKAFFVLTLLMSLAVGASGAQAMGSGNPFSDAQTGLTYGVYKPTQVLTFKRIDFRLIPCTQNQEEWVYSQYGTSKKYFEIMETMAGVKCSDPGIAKKLSSIKINGVIAKVFVYCDPANQALWKKCTTASIAKNGGYLMFSTKATKYLKGTEIQVQGIGGVSYSQLLAVARGLSLI